MSPSQQRSPVMFFKRGRPTRGPARAMAIIGVAACLVACSDLNPMRPSPVSESRTKDRLTDLQKSISNNQNNYNNSLNELSKTELRNKVVSDKILAEDLVFEDFAWSAWGADATAATAGDWALLGLTGAASLITGGASQVLSATATAVTGAKTSLQKNVLYAKTVDQLIFAMAVTRTQIRTHIQACLKYPDSLYNLSVANIDLEQYKQAAILPIAIANLSQSKTNASTQDECFTSVAVTTLAHDDGSKTIKDWVEPNGEVDTGHRAKLLKWMQNSSNPALHDTVWFVILTATASDADRKNAIAQIPIK